MGRVLFSLLQSRDPVVAVITKMNGVERDRIEGLDLRKVPGAYIQLPTVAGSYALSVEARTAAGCSALADRPMTVVVGK
jgi:hypothetical protein